MPKTFKHLTRIVVMDGADFLPDVLKKWSAVANQLQHIVITHKAQGMTIQPHTHYFPDGSYKHESHPDHVPLMWDHLTEQMGRQQVSSVLTWMLKNGFLERTHHYDPDVHAYGYRLGPVLRGLPRKKVKITDASFLERVSKFQHANMKNWGKGHRHRRDWSKRMEVNVVAMRNAIRDLPADTRDSVNIVIDMLEDGDFNWKVCEYRRYHDVFTCLMSGLRRYISYKGVPLVGVDIANSQPFILGSLILASYTDRSYKAGVSLNQISVRLDEDGADPEEEQANGGPPSIRRHYGAGNQRKPLDKQRDRRIPKTPESEQENGPEDLIRYINLCQRGKLYEYLMERTGHVDKRLFKDICWFHFLYGSNKDLDRCRADAELHHLVPLIELFTSEFPTVYEYMWKAKTRNFRRLPCEMQRLEAHIMIDTVVGWLKEHRPTVPLLTIHDSVLTTPEHVPFVTRLIEVAFEAHGFLKPTLHVEFPVVPEMGVAA